MPDLPTFEELCDTENDLILFIMNNGRMMMLCWLSL